MTYAIVGFTVLISLLAFKDRKVFESMMFEPFVINVRKDWFRLITHGFIHGNMAHLAVNMFVLFMFGQTVERGYAEITGRSSLLPFLVLYLAGITLSSLPAYYKHRWNPEYRAVGASGATSAVVFASILMYPTSKLYLLILPIPAPAWVFGILYLGYEWYMGQRGNDGIAHDAHFAGALVGVLFTAALEPRVVPAFFEAISGIVLMKRCAAVFLDRDGVINRERGEHTWQMPDFEVLPTVAQAVKAITAAGKRAVVITNQSGIGLGLYGHTEVDELHRYLHAHLAQQGAALDAVYYCPHHPSNGKCLCRKPGSLLLERAIARFDIDPSASVMIGDRERDIQAADAVGVRGVLVAPNAALMSVLMENGAV